MVLSNPDGAGKTMDDFLVDITDAMQVSRGVEKPRCTSMSLKFKPIQFLSATNTELSTLSSGGKYAPPLRKLLVCSVCVCPMAIALLFFGHTRVHTRISSPIHVQLPKPPQAQPIRTTTNGARSFPHLPKHRYRHGFHLFWFLSCLLILYTM